MATTVNLNVITPRVGGIIDPLWTQTSQHWLRDMGIMLGLSVIFTLLAYIRLRASARAGASDDGRELTARVPGAPGRRAASGAARPSSPR